MLKIIAHEARHATEYVRRAEAFASTEANPPSDSEIATTWLDVRTPHAEKRARARAHKVLVQWIRKARKVRLSVRDCYFRNLIAEAR